MISTNPMGPGFFIFFQTEGEQGGAYEHHPYAFTPKILRKAKGKEEKKAAKIAEEVIEVHGQEATQDDLELVLRLRLRIQAIEYKAVYFEWVKEEFTRIKVARTKARRKKKAVMLLLH